MPRLNNGIQRIAVFRALMLGDVLCAVPALRALRAGYPDARITLIALPWARALMPRLCHVDDFIAFPGFPGLPEMAPQLPDLPAFFQRTAQAGFDLMLQLHGRGDLSNPIAAACGARHLAGFFAPGAYCPEPPLYVPWPEHAHEIERLLLVTDALGLARQGVQLEFPVTDADRQKLLEAWPVRRPARYACVHPGSQLPSRRWPVQYFAQVCDALADAGLAVVLTGVASEQWLGDALRAHVRSSFIDMIGRTTLWELGALIEGAQLLLCNDTSVSHIASALKTPSVVVSCGADAARWAPLDRSLHRLLWVDVPCRPCAHRECPTAHECAMFLDPTSVVQASMDQLRHARTESIHA